MKFLLQMGSVQLFVNQNRLDKKGHISVCVQVTNSRAQKRMTLFSIDPKFWDEKRGRVKYSHENNVRFNEKIIVTLSTLEVAILNLRKGEKFDIDTLLYGPVETIVDKPVLSLVDYLEKYKKKILNTASIGYIDNVDVLIRKITSFRDIPEVSQVTEEWIKNFFNFSKVSGVTFSGYLRKIRSALKIATNEKVDIERAAFDYKVKRVKKIKRKLKLNHLQKLMDLPISNILKLQKAKDFFLLQIYLLGMRAGDVLTLRYEHIVDGRIDKAQSKNDNEVSILIIPEAQEIIDRYKNNTYGYIMPYMKLQPKAPSGYNDEQIQAYKRKYHEQKKTNLREINEYLKIVAEQIGFPYNLSTHISRHSVAVIANKMKIPIEQISGFLGHSDLDTTKLYLEELMESDELDASAEGLFEKLRKK